MSVPHIIARSDLIVTVPHPVGIFVRDIHLNIRIAQPPMGVPKNDIKMHWHRNFQRDPKNKWLRELVASMFNDESDEWRVDRWARPRRDMADASACGGGRGVFFGDSRGQALTGAFGVSLARVLGDEGL